MKKAWKLQHDQEYTENAYNSHYVTLHQQIHVIRCKRNIQLVNFGFAESIFIILLACMSHRKACMYFTNSLTNHSVLVSLLCIFPHVWLTIRLWFLNDSWLLRHSKAFFCKLIRNIKACQMILSILSLKFSNGYTSVTLTRRLNADHNLQNNRWHLRIVTNSI